MSMVHGLLCHKSNPECSSAPNLWALANRPPGVSFLRTCAAAKEVRERLELTARVLVFAVHRRQA